MLYLQKILIPHEKVPHFHNVNDKQMSDNGGVRFIRAIWDSKDVDELKGCICLSTPSEIMNVTI